MHAEHDLKSWTQFFVPILSGERVHELRRNDRNFRVGDILNLHEWDALRAVPTGRIANARITSITSDDHPCAVSDVGLVPGFCILSIRLLDN
ncbi:DUF3850 domain-containing protein [Frigoribacterium sp. CFBP 13605]|uniref:DUF3850 domain-containing protein n=1 Tax=Frigoribacterium sp. CFBP 13605 TaxID=2774034 RepID=UPI0035A99F30